MLTVRKLHPQFGAEIVGLSLRDNATPEIGAEIRELILKYGLVVISRQDLNDKAYEDFAATTGELWRFKPGETSSDSYSDAIFALGNIDSKGNLLPHDGRSMAIHKGNQLWHTDMSFYPRRGEFSFLLSRVIPESGGETELCDTRVAYEGLSPERKKFVDGLFAYHSLAASRAKTGFTDLNEDHKKAKPVRRPVVQVHESGRKAMYLASHIGLVEGYSEKDSQALVDDLVAEATQRDRLYIHTWNVGDLLIWDNRCMMHRATPFDDYTKKRDMRCIRTLDMNDG
jgi:alpha-ketoglutarate-dependent 2,4-dichlorophenoxyacetate dioxygenase